MIKMILHNMCYHGRKTRKLPQIPFTLSALGPCVMKSIPVSILYKSIAGRCRPVRVADGPITARYRFVKIASWDLCRKFRFGGLNKLTD